MYPTAPDNNKQKIIASLVAIIAVAIIGGGVRAYEQNQSPLSTGGKMTLSTPASSPSSSSTSATSAGSASPATSGGSQSSFKDGSYSSTNYYYVPSGTEGIKVSLTVHNGVITDSSVQNSETNPESARFQEDFASEYKSYVVGKNLSGLYLQYVAGASDTTRGFDDALQQIQNQAKA